MTNQRLANAKLGIRPFEPVDADGMESYCSYMVIAGRHRIVSS